MKRWLLRNHSWIAWAALCIPATLLGHPIVGLGLHVIYCGGAVVGGLEMLRPR